MAQGKTKLIFTKEYFNVTEVEVSGNKVQVKLNSIYDVLAEKMLHGVTIASNVHQRQEEAASIVSVITREEIELYGARDISDVLRLIPGFEFGMDVNSLYGLFFRGAWGLEGKVLVMVDGLCVNELAYGVYNFIGTIPASMISRIEIIRGPGSAIYGGFAEVAVINVITMSGNELEGVQVFKEFVELSCAGLVRICGRTC